MNSLFQLEIPKRNGQCAQGGEKFLPGMDIFSLLSEEDLSSTITRRDFCSECWKGVKESQRGNSSSHGYWKSTIEKRKESEGGGTRIDRALALLKSLQQSPENKEAEIFVLSLFLSHAKQLALRKEIHKEGETYFLYEILRNEEFIRVKTIKLSQLQTDILQKSLADQLQKK